MSERDGRTEKPTAKHVKEARRDGRVAKSPDVGSWMSLLGIVLVAPSLLGGAERSIVNLIAQATDAMATPDTNKALGLLGAGLRTVLSVSLPFGAIAAGVGVAASLAQTGLRLSPGAIGFNWSKLSPRNGLKRFVSPAGVWDLAKNFGRLVALGLVGYGVARHLDTTLLIGGTLPLQASLGLATSGLVAMMREVGALALLFGLVDYGVQRRKIANSLKMTRDQVKREAKEQDANPEVRARIRRRQRELTRMQMIAALADADVVVVNPTHYAVGLAYERSRHRAPTVLAKGEDDIAAAIRSAALGRRIPIVESPPLARALHASCSVGQEIPPELYEVVAKLFAFVYRLSPTARALVDVHHLAARVPEGVGA